MKRSANLPRSFLFIYKYNGEYFLISIAPLDVITDKIHARNNPKY